MAPFVKGERISFWDPLLQKRTRGVIHTILEPYPDGSNEWRIYVYNDDRNGVSMVWPPMNPKRVTDE